MQNVSDRLRQVMQVFGLTQAQMAAGIGVTAAQMSRWVLGQNSLPETTALAFQAIYGVRREWLLRGEAPQRPGDT